MKTKIIGTIVSGPEGYESYGPGMGMFCFAFLMVKIGWSVARHYQNLLEDCRTKEFGSRCWYSDGGIIQFQLIDDETLWIINELSADEEGEIQEDGQYKLKPLLNFIPILEHALDHIDFKMVSKKITFDGQQYKLYIDDVEYTDSYGTFDEYSELVRANKLPKPSPKK